MDFTKYLSEDQVRELAITEANMRLELKRDQLSQRESEFADITTELRREIAEIEADLKAAQPVEEVQEQVEEATEENAG